MMNRYNYRIALTLSLLLLLAAAGAHAQVQLIRLPEVEEGDTLRCGIFRIADGEQFKALRIEYDELMKKQFSTETKQNASKLNAEFSNEGLNKKIAECEAKRKQALKNAEKMAAGDMLAQLKKQINDQYDQVIAELPKIYGQAKQQIAPQDKALTSHDASEYSNEKKYAVKRRMAALAVGGRLMSYTDSHDFRYGRAGVAKLVNGRELWGFIDESGQQVVPCKYRMVYDFKNRRYRSSGVFDPQEDKDDRMWTTVIEPVNSCMGMIDADGREVIPCRFIPHSSGYDLLVFYKTPWGEYAPVQEYASGKYGIINRSGTYTLAPTYDGIIRYDEERQCFSYFSFKNTERFYFDHTGSQLNKQ